MEIYLVVERVIADAVELGELFGSPSEIVQVMWMGWHGLVSLLIQRPNFPWGLQTATDRRCSRIGGSVPSHPKSFLLDIGVLSFSVQ
jgi:hypothetical protein